MYLWIDTICINKSDFSELHEAINSMWRWYQQAVGCIAYLHDVPAGSTQEEFERSVWFRRGWTLQELLAPKDVIFLDNSWSLIGVKTPAEDTIQANVPSLCEWIATATGIPESILHDYSAAKNLTTDEKRAWMKYRKCTRLEDEAYCLLGICGVYMPLIYGERERAFDRLEEEIESRELYLQRRALRQPAPKPPSPEVSSGKQRSWSLGASSMKPGATLLVVHDFEARSSDELSLAKGDRIELVEKDDDFADGWYIGKKLADGSSGLFPEVYTTPAPTGTRSDMTKDSTETSAVGVGSVSNDGGPSETVTDTASNNLAAPDESSSLSPDVNVKAEDAAANHSRSRSRSRSRAVLDKFSKLFAHKREESTQSGTEPDTREPEFTKSAMVPKVGVGSSERHTTAGPTGSEDTAGNIVPEIKVDSTESTEVTVANIVEELDTYLKWTHSPESEEPHHRETSDSESVYSRTASV